MANAIKFKHTEVSRQPGERARLKVVQGPNVGSIYVITGNQASIGRGEENDIVLADLKSSRFHAAIFQGKDGKWRVKDQGSANGILLNSKPARESEVKTNDVITVGETVLEFVGAEMGTQILMAPARSPAQVQADQKSFQSAREQVNRSFGSFTGNVSGAVGGAGKNRKIVLYAVGAVGVGFLLLGDPDSPSKSKSNTQGKAPSSQDLASFLPAPAYNKTADTLFKDGLREYFDSNYGRARTQFETVLQISPGHVLATLYLENCNKAVVEEVKLNLNEGKKSFDAGKFRDAKGHFETVMRLLYGDQANPSYIEARDQLDKLIKAMQPDGGKA